MDDTSRAVGRSGIRPLMWLLVALSALSVAGATVLLFGTSTEAFALAAGLLVVAVLLLFLLDFR